VQAVGGFGQSPQSSCESFSEFCARSTGRLARLYYVVHPFQFLYGVVCSFDPLRAESNVFGAFQKASVSW
jgi:hypothetical protein